MERVSAENSTGKIAYIFPGQGSQSVGMGREIAEKSAAARQVFEEADDALGFSLSEMCWNGTTEDLALTENTQPAILTTSVAVFRAMEESGMPLPDFAAGHSLGEYSALVAAGAIKFADAVKTVRNRGKYMQEAVPLGVGAMAAILGADLETVENACREAAINEVCAPANINSQAQTVIAGNAEAVDRAIELLKARGAKRAIKLNVSAPFHCALMMPAQERLAEDLQNIVYGQMRFPVIHNVNAEVNFDGENSRDLLTRQVSSPVRWLATIEKMKENGVETFVEVGAGKVLSGLVKQINRDAKTFSVEDSAGLQTAQESLS